MFTNNPYAQGGWANPANPLSVYNGTWGEHSAPQASVYGALPSAASPAPPKILTFYFVSLNPNILNSTVVGPSRQTYFDVMTSSVGSAGQTVLMKAGKRCAVVEWVHPAYVNIEVQGAVPKQTAGRFLELSNDQSYRSMQVFGRWYAWVPRDGIYSLFTVGPNQPELLARVSKEPDVVKLEITAQAVQLGLLEAVVTSTILLHSGRNFG